MKFNLYPREKVFYQLLENLTLKAEKTIHKFKELTDTWSLTTSLQEIKNLEHECDDMIHEIMLKLNKSFVTPIDREDIHHLAQTIDDVVDTLHALCTSLTIFKIETLKPPFLEMVDILDKIGPVMVKAVSSIRNLNHVDTILAHCAEINNLESQGDRVYERALSELFATIKDPIDVIKWKEIFDFLEQAIDKCEDIGDIVSGIVVKYG